MERVSFHSEESGFCVDPEDATVVVDFDGRQVDYEFGKLDEVVLAYTATVHKSQGSAYPAVVIPLSTQHYPMTEDRENFVRAVNRFSSNYAPDFGRLLAPVVQGLRVAGPFRPAWGKEGEELPRLYRDVMRPQTSYCSWTMPNNLDSLQYRTLLAFLT